MNMHTPSSISRERLVYIKRWRQDNPENVKISRKRYADTHRREQKEYRENHKEAARIYAKQYYIKNRDKIIARVLKNGAAYKKHKKLTDPVYKLQSLLRTRVWVALKRRSKKGSAVGLLGCTTEEAMTHIESQFLPGMTFKNWSHAGWHVDHKIPLSAFDLQDKKQLAMACHYTNLQPMWAKENIRKGGVRKGYANKKEL